MSGDTRLNQQQIDEIFKLYDKGFSIGEIAHTLPFCDRTSLYYRIQHNNRKSIANRIPKRKRVNPVVENKISPATLTKIQQLADEKRCIGLLNYQAYLKRSKEIEIEKMLRASKGKMKSGTTI